MTYDNKKILLYTQGDYKDDMLKAIEKTKENGENEQECKNIDIVIVACNNNKYLAYKKCKQECKNNTHMCQHKSILPNDTVFSVLKTNNQSQTLHSQQLTNINICNKILSQL